jgi:antitoxin (DNA-binding transcriptional repressor) of toxin-antitoxin stability system
MPQIDLDDLPPRIARALDELRVGDELILVRNGAVVARLTVGEAPAPEVQAPDLPPEQEMKEIMEHFNAMIHDEF